MQCITSTLELFTHLLEYLVSEKVNVNEISAGILEFKSLWPHEFARDCRSLNYSSKFKATELRQFLLYGCPLFLRELVSETIYNHWLLLHVAVRLLSNNRSEKLLQKSVRDYPKIYGTYSVVYNVHVLLHIHYYVRLYGSLDSLSAYKFENFIHSSKKCVVKDN